MNNKLVVKSISFINAPVEGTHESAGSTELPEKEVCGVVFLPHFRHLRRWKMLRMYGLSTSRDRSREGVVYVLGKKGSESA
jgi:hypothetical protein